MKKVAFLLYDDAEVLDFSGPFDVFSMSKVAYDDGLFDLMTLSRDGKPVTAIHGFKVCPTAGIGDVGPGDIDILIVPGGGPAVIKALGQGKHDDLVDWIGAVAPKTTATATVCVGAFFGAKAGLFANRRATTHHGFIGRLKDWTKDQGTEVIAGPRYVDGGGTRPAILSSAGVSAGIDLAFHMLERFASDDPAKGRDARLATQNLMEWNGTTNWYLA